MKKKFEYKDEKSHKFWEITTDDNQLTVRFGKVDSKGQSKTKEFDSAQKTEKEAAKLIKQKTKKGYVQVSGDIEPQTSSQSNIDSAWNRLEKWFKENQPELLNGLNKKRASSKEINHLEKTIKQKLPESVKAFYKKHNGWNGCFIDFIENFLSLKEIEKTYQLLGEFPEYKNQIPFTVSSRARDHFCIDTNPDSKNLGQIVFLSTDDDDIEIVADSFEHWIEQLILDLEAGKYDEGFEMI